MRTFAQKQNQPQKPVSSSLARPHLATLGPDHREHPLLHLQRTIGNQAVQQMLQTHAEELKTGLTGTASPRFGHDFSRIPIHPPAAGVLQTKLTVNQPGDEYEQEADRISEQVMWMPELQLQRACACGGACPKCQTEQLGQEHESLQTKSVQASDTGQIGAPPIVHEVLRSPGQPLDPATRAFMESRFGHDFSRVQVHSGAAAEQSASEVNAHAYTVGHNIVFGAGRFAAGTHEGRRLIAHELTHVVQQQQGFEAGGQTGGTLLAQRQPKPGKSETKGQAPSKQTSQPPSSFSGKVNDPGTFWGIDLDILAKLYASRDVKAFLIELGDNLVAGFIQKYFTVDWLEGRGRKAIEPVIIAMLTNVYTEERKRTDFLFLTGEMHASKFEPSRVRWLKDQVSVFLPLTTEQRDQLKIELTTRMGDAYTNYIDAANAVAGSIKAEAAAEAALDSLFFDVFMGLAAPGLARGIASLADKLPASASNFAYKVSLKAMDESSTVRLFAAATKVGKDVIKGRPKVLFGETKTDLFIDTVKKTFLTAKQAVIDDLRNKTDTELGVLTAMFDNSMTDKDHYVPIIQKIVGHFEREIVPIGSFLPGSTEVAGAGGESNDLYFVQKNSTKYLVLISVTSAIWTVRYSFRTFIDYDFHDAAIERAKATQPRGIETLSADEIRHFPHTIPEGITTLSGGKFKKSQETELK